ncbi:hypothetical protein ACOMHN_015164 [Nucella lapillus]
MTLTETLHGIVCQVCNKRFSGRVPAEQHLLSETHLRKVKLQERRQGHPLWCDVCSVLCNSHQQFSSHFYSPRHLHMTAQVDLIHRQQALTATQSQLGGDRKLGIKLRNIYSGNERQENEECLGAEGVVSDSDEAARGFVPPHNPSLSRMNYSPLPIPPDGVYFEYNKGHCYVCGIELTSLQHKTQHVEGKQHKKKALTFGGASNMNDDEANGRQGVMMCAICNIPLSGEQNVQQHFGSGKHKARKLEYDLQRQAGVSEPVSSDADAAPQPVPLPPTTTASFYGLYGPHSMPGRQISFAGQIPNQPLLQQQQQRPHQASVSVPSDRPAVADANDRDHLQPFEYGSQKGICRLCQQRFQSAEEFIKHLQSAEHKQREEETKQLSGQNFHRVGVAQGPQVASPSSAVFDFTGNARAEMNLMNTSHSLTFSQLSDKLASNSELEQEMKKLAVSSTSCDNMYFSLPPNTRNQHPGFHAPPMTRTAPSEERRLEQRPENMPSVPEYIFDGSRGVCNVCKIDFTSRSHAESHLAGAKHKKAVIRWQSAMAVQAADVSQSSQAFDAPQVGVQAVPGAAAENPSLTSNPLKDKQAYSFDGHRGYCFACKIELTSEAHASQHLVGKKHHSATERWIQDGENCSYPLFCNICLKPFTGQESAAQHFSSEKHKKKLSLSEGAAAARKDPETGALLVVLDNQMWYMCETCKCPLNTIDQFRLHVNSPRHNAEVEKVKKQDHSNRSSPVDGEHSSLPAARTSPDPSDLQHLVTRSNLVRTTTGAYFPPPQSVVGCSGLFPSGLNPNIPGTNGGNSAFVPSGLNPNFRPGSSGGNSAFDPSGLNPNIPGTNGGNPAFVPSGLNPNSRPGTGGGGALTALAGLSDQRAILKTTNIMAQVSGTTCGPPHLASGGGGHRLDKGAFSDLTKDLALQQISRGGAGSCGSRGPTQILRPAGDYEMDEEHVKSLPQSALTSDYHDPYAEHRPAEDADTSLTMSSIHWGYALSRTDEEKKHSAYAASTMSDRLTSIHTDPGSMNVTGYLQPKSESGVGQPRLSTPEINLLKRFRYACLLCKQPMNTKEDYERHMKGLKHQMKAATVSAPDKSQERLVKVYRVSSDEECHCCRTRPRKYQVELMRKAMAHDSTVVYLPTGTGKTLAAMMTLSCMLTLNSTRPVLFLVDKVLLVLQQARYIINELGIREFERPHLTEDGRMEKRMLKVAVLCGGLSVRDGTPLWKHDVIVTTAAFCQNLLQDEVLRWANFSLVVFDEAHHCTKNHPYNRLLSEHHNPLPGRQRPKVLGLTASPAGRPTEEETLAMLKTLLENLGGATIAIIEDKEAKEQLDTFSSSARLVPVCVPMTEDEMGFHEKLLSYFIRAYVELMICSNLQQISSQRLQDLMKPKPSDEDIMTQAQHLMSEPDELSEMVQLAQTARMKPSTAYHNRFENIHMHVNCGRFENIHMHVNCGRFENIHMHVNCGRFENIHMHVNCGRFENIHMHVNCGRFENIHMHVNCGRFENIHMHVNCGRFENIHMHVNCGRFENIHMHVNCGRFENIRMHVMTVGMTLLNSEDGIDFVLDDLERLFNPALNTCFDQLQEMGLPCKDIASYVSSLCDSAKLRTAEEGPGVLGVGIAPSSMSIFQELLVTLANPRYVNWDRQDSMALVLVRERKVAHKFKDHLKRTTFVRQRNMRLAVVVGHGAGSGEGEGMNLRKQDKVLQGIKSQRYDIIVATSVAEEGVDIPECQLVVCLNPPTTVKALVQMRGRARKKDSYFVVLCSSQREKEKLEDLQQQERNMKRAAARLTQQQQGAEG